jgi:hypothetical protein
MRGVRPAATFLHVQAVNKPDFKTNTSPDVYFGTAVILSAVRSIRILEPNGSTSITSVSTP